MDMGKKIRELRINAHLSQEELAEKLFTSQDTVSLWETGKSSPNAEMILKIAYLFDVTTDELLGKK